MVKHFDAGRALSPNSSATKCYGHSKNVLLADTSLFSRCAELGINNPALRMQLWDSLVQPTLMYGVEFWGVRDISKGVLAGDQLHRDFLRRLLGVHSGTPSQYGGVGGGWPLSDGGKSCQASVQLLEPIGRDG